MGPVAAGENEERLPQLNGQGNEPAPGVAYSKSLPTSVRYILTNAFSERYVFYGVKSVLALYLYQHLHLSENTATELFHLFVVVTYAAALVGAYFSDGLWGQYPTVLRLEVLYVAGISILLLASLPDPDVTHKVDVPVWGAALGIFLVGFSAGGIRPCLTTLGANQFENSSQGDRQVTEVWQSRFFLLFYFTTNAASVITKLVTPQLRANVSFAAAFGVCAAAMLVGLWIFWLGRSTYVDRPPQGNVYLSVGRIVRDAIKLRPGRDRTDGAEAEASLLNATDAEVEHWLDHAKAVHSEVDVEDLKRVLRVITLFLPATVFWSLTDQQGSKWVFQGSQMNGRISWLGGLVIQPDQMVALNPTLVLLMIPLVHQFIYPFLKRKGVPLHYIGRMVAGMLLNSSAFVVAALLQQFIYRAVCLENEPGEGRISILCQVPQYILITAGEVLLSITGLAFAYSEAPESMKSVVQAVWVLTIAGGNIVTVIVVAIIGERLSKTNEFLVFAGICTLASLLLAWLGSGFAYKQAATLDDVAVPSVADPQAA